MLERHHNWEYFRMHGGSKTEYGFTYDLFDELMVVSTRVSAEFTSGNYIAPAVWNNYADELGQCRKHFYANYEYRQLMFNQYTDDSNDDFLYNEKGCFQYLAARARGREYALDEDDYAKLLANNAITLEDVEEFRRKLMVRRIYERYLDTPNVTTLFTTAAPVVVTGAANVDTALAGLTLPGSASAWAAIIGQLNGLADSVFFPTLPSSILVGSSQPEDTLEKVAPAVQAELPAVHAKPFVGTSLTIGNKVNSDDIQNDLFKLAACPTMREKCGARNIDLTSHKSQPVELKISDFNQDDQCTWNIKTHCGLPTITVTDITKNIADHLEVGFIEYEAVTDELDADMMLPLEWKTDIPAHYSFPERQIVGTLQTLKFIDPFKTDSVDGSSLYSSLNSKRIAVEQYKKAREEYETLRLEYNNAVQELTNTIDSAILQNDSSANEAGILDQIIALFQGEINDD